MFDKTAKMDSNLQDLQELESYLLRGITTVDPRATECTPGTRTSILADLATKTDDRDGSNTILIRGAPGSGKSSISLSAKSRLQNQGRLITYYRFDRNEASATTPTALWRIVAYHLARRLPSLRMQLLAPLRNDTVDLDSATVVFTSLIESPLSKLTNLTVEHPLVIVIDAVDECGGLAGHLSPDRQALLQTLRRWPRLPKHFKLLVTSRPEGDVTRILSSVGTSIDIPSGYFLTENPRAQASIDTSNDIYLFLEVRFRAIRQRFTSLPIDWPGPGIIRDMVHRAEGIFMWATTAANFIDLGLDPRRRLCNIMEDTCDSSGMEPLYSLYAVILEMAFGQISDGGLEAEILRSVLGIMVLAKRPLADTEYVKLPTTEPITEATLDAIREGLRSVIAPGGLRFLHKSFDDFLLSKECPSKYAIRKDESQHLLTNFCLMTMKKELHFNMCNLETSCLRNTNVPGIENKITEGISSFLSYSCLFFADHLYLAPFDYYLMDQVKVMIMKKLLYWFEAMSLLKEIKQISHSLLLILEWSHLSPDDGFKDFLRDARRFIGAFGHPIALSAPHIYISALPFAPEHSSVAKHFLPRFPWILELSTGKPVTWSPCIFTSEQHYGDVVCVVFSPDEKYFASGSMGGEICVCESETGTLMSGPFGGGDRLVCVFFGPDGHHVWGSYWDHKVICWDIQTGDRHLTLDTPEYAPYCRFDGSRNIVFVGNSTIALWNAETGRRELYHQDEDWSYLSISPDGCSVAVAGKGALTIKIWRVVDESQVQEISHIQPQYRHSEPISAVSFSADGNFVVSASRDGTILIWDTRTGDAVGRPLDTKDVLVYAVAYSPKSQRLVSASGVTGTVMVWNALTHEVVLGPLDGHTLTVWEMALSRDGQRALTASEDGTVRMWDLNRGEVRLATHSTDVHTNVVKCVAFSPCGKKFASVDPWGAIRVWDVACPTQPLHKCHVKKVIDHSRMIFSPDGSQILAYGAGDGTIGVWNTDTGELAFDVDLSDHNCDHTYISHASFRTTDQRLVTCSSNGAVRIGSLRNGVPQVFAKLPEIVAMSPDGLTVTVRDKNRNPHFYKWSTTAHRPLPFTFDYREYASGFPSFSDDKYISGLPVAYSPSGRLFASISDFVQGACTLQVWNTRTGDLVARASIPMLDDTHRPAFSPDDRHIAISCASSYAIWIHDARTGYLVSGPWSGHSDHITTLTFSPDGEKLVSGSSDRQIRVWNSADLLRNSKQSVASYSEVRKTMGQEWIDNTDPASTFWVPKAPIGFLEAEEYMEDGWVKGADKSLLFWVPKDHRPRLVWPQSVLVEGCGTTTKLNLSRFRYGKYWAECFGGEHIIGSQVNSWR